MKWKHRCLNQLAICFLIAIISQPSKAQVMGWNGEVFKVDTLADHLAFPWEVTYGPDDSLWVTEAKSYKVIKIHPGNKGKREIIDLSDDKNFPNCSGGGCPIWPQGGMMGLAIHPDFNAGKRYVYVAYVYRRNGSCPSGTSSPCYYNTKIVIFLYPNTDSKKYSLCYGDTVISDLPGSNDHNSGRLAIGPDQKLYYTIGDMGAGQFNNSGRTNNAQNTNIYEGKILRLNLEPDNNQNGGDEWIPDDNPFPATGGPTAKNAIYTYGHRNAQGLVWANVNGTDRLFSAEHGDKSDDEVNLIEVARNYGWPFVAGLCDNNYTTLDNPGITDNDKLASMTVGREDTFCNNHNVKQPIFGLFNAKADDIPADGSNIFTWPTVAPSSIDYYKQGYIPGWNYSLLVTSLKYGMYRLKLKTPPGTVIDSTSSPEIVDTLPYFHGLGRFRDIAIAPTGDTLFVAVDSSGSTSGPTGGFNGGNISTPNAGRILRIVYLTVLNVKDNNAKGIIVNYAANILVYPNPASSVINVISKKGERKPIKAQLFDITGKLVKEEVNSSDYFSMQVGNFRRGVYILRLYNGYDATMVTQKIVLQ